MCDGTIYQSNAGEYFGDAEVWERLESGVWEPFCWDVETGVEGVQTATHDLLILVPISPDALPEGIHVKSNEDGNRIVE